MASSFDTSKYGTSYTVPVGTDTPVPSGASNPFAYTASFVQASEDGTVVQIDRDADGTVDVLPDAGRGQAARLTTSGTRTSTGSAQRTPPVVGAGGLVGAGGVGGDRGGASAGDGSRPRG